VFELMVLAVDARRPRDDVSPAQVAIALLLAVSSGWIDPAR